MNLVKSIVFQSRHRQGEPAIASAAGIATYGALIKATEAAVEALDIFRLAPGELVMLDIRNPLHHTAMIFALALLGLPSASVGTTFVVEKAGVLPKLFLTDRDDINIAGVRVMRVDERWFTSDPKAVPDFAKLLSLPGFASPDDIVRYVYSSGTTGYPKCVALTQACLERRITRAQSALSWSVRGPAALNMMGFSTIAGIMAPLLAHLGGVLLCYPNGNAEAVQMIRLFHVSTLALAVGQLQRFLDEFGDAPPLNSLRLLSVAGAKLTNRLLAEVRARLCTNVWVGYGSTEMGSMSSGPARALDHDQDSAGYVVPFAKLEIVTVDGAAVPTGTEGIIRVRTPDAAFYVDEKGQPVEMFADGWFYPGDVGRIEPDGQLIVTGRTNDVINRGGVIVAPEVIEDVLRLDSRLKDVAVVGVPARNGMEEIWAAVVAPTQIDGAALAEASRPRLNEKVPDRIVQVETIPRNANGKVQRNLLREQLLAL